MLRNRLYFALATGVGLGALMSTPALAQTGNPAEADAETSATSSGLDDIVVTGRKRARAETLQSTPLAVTALGAEQLERGAVKDLVDIGRLTPSASLQSSAQRGNQNFAIRGMGVSGSTVSDEPAVGIIQDGVYWGTNYGALNQLLDLESVEVLRGPQGTLFGRNVTGGALIVRSARPSDNEEARFSFGYGNNEALEAVAIINKPIISDVLAFRLAGQIQKDDGYLYDTVRDRSYGGTTQIVVRPSLKLTPAPGVSITAIGEYYTLNGDPVGARGRSPTTIPGGPVTLPTREGYVTPTDFWSVSPDTPGFSHIDVYSGMLEGAFDVLGGTFTSITGYRKVKTRVLTDYDGTPSRGFLQGIKFDQNQFSQEFSFAADLTDWLSLTSGLYYFRQKVLFGEFRRLNNDASLLGTRSDLVNTSYAGYAEVDIKPIEALTVTLGGRYTHEKKVAKTAPFGACNLALTTCNFGETGRYSENNFTPKIGLSYQVDSSKLLYASFTKGFRSGGFSLRGTPLAEPYEAETVKAYEIGFKTDWLNRHVRFNGSFYRNEFSNLQRTVIGVSPTQGVISSVFNAADATIKGVEFELMVLPVDNLTLGVNYSYTHARYQAFQGFDNPDSLRFVRVPATTLNLSADYEIAVGNTDRVNINVNGAYSDGYKWDDRNTPTLETPSVWLLSSTVSYTLNDQMTLSIWGKNLLNERYSVWGSTLGALGQNEFPAAPRTYGARVSVEF